MTCRLSDIISPAFVEPHRAVKAHEVSEVVSKGGRASTKSSWISVELVLLFYNINILIFNYKF